MKPIPRRTFIRGTALAGGALLFLPGIQGCRLTGGKSSGNYFLGEFGIDEPLCSKLLAKALSREVTLLISILSTPSQITLALRTEK